MKGLVVGYDPGGNQKHGVAVLPCSFENGKWSVNGAPLCKTCASANATFDWLASVAEKIPVIAAGIDTLTAWSGSHSGWREGDLRLRAAYPAVHKCVDNANHINGSMILSGTLMVRHLRSEVGASIPITEAHPKVLHFELSGESTRHPAAKAYAKRNVPPVEDWNAAFARLSRQLGVEVQVSTVGGDHIYDALLGALAALKGINREWPFDLHEGAANLVHPFGLTHYWWPRELPLHNTD